MKEWLRRLIKPIITVEDLRKIIAKDFPEYHLARNPGETRKKNRQDKKGELNPLLSEGKLPIVY